MDCSMTLPEYEALPFRDDWPGEYEREKFYRARAFPGMVFQWHGSNHYALWWCFKVKTELVAGRDFCV